MVPRIINLPFKRNSVFLFGPRQVGKSTLIQYLLAGEEHVEIDLLKGDVFLKYKTNPSRLRAECEFIAKENKLVFGMPFYHSSNGFIGEPADTF